MSDALEDTRSVLVTDPARPAAPRIVALWDGGGSAALLPESGELVIGRAVGCDLRIPLDSVSRQHARVRAGTPPTIEDLGSANGTRVDGRRLGASERAPLVPGQVVDVGTATLVLQAPAPPPPAHTITGGMAQVHRLADVVARGDIAVIIQGETGVGKEVLAERIHARSRRAGRKLLRINCAAFPEAMVESELFGHERGAFTGATGSKVGLLEAADGGTLLFDEIADLPLAAQAKLLRAVGQGEVLRLGSTEPRRVDVRFIAATHKPLTEAVASGTFRADLYYRLNGVTLWIPPLRARRDEIPGLAQAFADRAAARLGVRSYTMGADVLAWLRVQPWPGNVRELETAIERAVLLGGDGRVTLSSLQVEQRPLHPATTAAPSPTPASLRDELDDLEKKRILDALERCGGNQTRAAKALGMSRRTLINRLEAYGVPRPRRDAED